MDSDLEPRAILAHLNSLGYKNVSSDQLKEFIRDLKSLIKYESKYSIEEQSPLSNVNLLSNLIERSKQKHDHKEKYRSHTNAEMPKQRTESRGEKPTIDITINQNSNTWPKKTLKKQTSCNDDHKENRISEENRQTTSIPSTCASTQKPNSRKCSGKFIRNTPTDLYQKYKEDWDRFKNFMPGENSREDVRQAVHRKLQHRPDSAPKTYLCFTNDRKLIKRM